jgi:hypothetical protein
MRQLRKVSAINEIQRRCEELAKREGERQSATVVQLPLWQHGKRGSPNSFLRSALFAAIQSKDRVYLEDATLFSQQGCTVKFTGRQLNQEDMTIWLALTDIARLHPLGTECGFTAYGILKHVGLKNGGEQSERLRLSVERMTACMVKIETSKFVYGGSLIEKFVIDKDTRRYKITLNPDLIKLFRDNDWTALNWEQRKKLRSKPLAQKLHEYYSSHERPLPLTIEFLHDITGSDNKDKYDFKRRIKSALNELVKIGFLASYKVEGDKVAVERRNPRALPAART